MWPAPSMTHEKCARIEEYNPFHSRNVRYERGREPEKSMLAGYLYYTVWGRVREDRWAYIRQGTGVWDRERMDIRTYMNAGGEAEGR